MSVFFESKALRYLKFYKNVIKRFQFVYFFLLAIERTPLGEESNVEKEVQKKLKLYEDFLKNKMRNNVQKFLVHFSSQFDLEGCNAGSTITAWVDRNLHTLEEKREE